MTRPAQPRETPAAHGCPGDCGRKVPRHQLACPACWRRLPTPLQRNINVSYRALRLAPHDAQRARQHRLAVAAAIAWYRDNPPAGRP